MLAKQGPFVVVNMRGVINIDPLSRICAGRPAPELPPASSDVCYYKKDIQWRVAVGKKYDDGGRNDLALVIYFFLFWHPLLKY